MNPTKMTSAGRTKTQPARLSSAAMGLRRRRAMSEAILPSRPDGDAGSASGEAFPGARRGDLGDLDVRRGLLGQLGDRVRDLCLPGEDRLQDRVGVLEKRLPTRSELPRSGVRAAGEVWLPLWIRGDPR